MTQLKILYAIQGTGNGHISRAREMIPILQTFGELDILISGHQSDVGLSFPIQYQLNGLSFVFGKKGGIDLLQTFKKSKLKRLFKDIKSLPVEKYDVIINDFEPVSAWACKLKGIPCIGLSHQAAVINPLSPKPTKFDPVGKLVLKKYAPVTSSYGFHFEKYDTNIYTPVIRKEIRTANPKKAGHYTVYLPAYSEDWLIKVLCKIDTTSFQVFCKNATQKKVVGNIKIFPIDNLEFIKSMVNSNGVLCGAGFETPAEVLFMKKKLLVIPMKGQFEQQCNAEALHKLGVPVIKKFDTRYLSVVQKWINNDQKININFPDETTKIISMIIMRHSKHTKFTETKKQST